MQLSSRTLNQYSRLITIFASIHSKYSAYPPRTLLACPSKPISILHQSNRGFDSVSHALKSTVDNDVKNEDEDCGELPDALKQKIKEVGINCSSCTPGEFHLLVCPKCKGGQKAERSLSFHVAQNKNLLLWRCFADECGCAGQVTVDSQATRSGGYPKSNSFRQLTEEGLNLKPLDDELIAYFSERNISRKTLDRNGVMQISGQKVIAFTYRRDKAIIGCKYRSIKKRFWQVKGTEKILYGLDDIRDADEIIVVEGEVDKLSMEEAGISNCVAVPGGAPQKVSKKLPSAEKDSGFQYVWNCKEYFDKASRIILATDADIPGQSLAEELARRLGRERCWRVCWPKRDEFSSFKDANEVLKELGPNSLRDVIYESELQPM